MKRVSGAQQTVVGVPVVLKPVEVEVPALTIPVKVRDVQVAVRAAPYCTKHRLGHRFLSTLEAVSNSES